MCESVDVPDVWKSAPVMAVYEQQPMVMLGSIHVSGNYVLARTPLPAGVAYRFALLVHGGGCSGQSICYCRGHAEAVRIIRALDDSGKTEMLQAVPAGGGFSAFHGASAASGIVELCRSIGAPYTPVVDEAIRDSRAWVFEGWDYPPEDLSEWQGAT